MNKLTAETFICAGRESVWRYTQSPELHKRWDLRFSDIDYLPRNGTDEPQRFRYARRLGLGIVIEGWGETTSRAQQKTSALRFGSADPKSLILEGGGFWAYEDEASGTRFSTVYDYVTRYGLIGRLLDVVLRPLMIWATRWSFDRLRIWIEEGTTPETSLRMWMGKVVTRCALGLIWVYEGVIPKNLFPSAGEVDLVRESGFYWPDPTRTLTALGIAEVVFGVWLLSGRAERAAAALSTIAVVGLSVLVCVTRPDALADPLGGISKNIALIACAIVVILLSPKTPLARRARPGRLADGSTR